MDRVTGKKFMNQYRAGKWQGIDIYQSYMTGYELVLSMNSPTRLPRIKRVYVGGYLKDKIIQHTNEGKSY
ncbi:MAG: hypothetical protein HUJ56_03290 [Erysipelotrichaceae bacterium]|nr:hypothetical protein [Erysipelotrichaceae bacterium]